MGRLTVGSSVGELGDRSHVGVTGLFNHREFGRERRQFSEPSIEEVYDTAQIPGFDDGVDTFELTPTFIYDSRNREVTPSEGVYLDLFGGHTLPVNDEADYWHYGGAFATFVNLYRETRVLAFRAIVEAVHGQRDEIPFTELMRLGGPKSLRGYQLDRFRDKVSAMGSVEYRYPVHQLVSGEVFLDAGRVGRDYTEVFDREGLRDFHLGGGLGFVFHSEDKMWFKAQAAYGEELLFFISTDPLRTFRRRHKRL
jgi:outer membrane protein assembly factor BamA